MYLDNSLYQSKYLGSNLCQSKHFQNGLYLPIYYQYNQKLPIAPHNDLYLSRHPEIHQQQQPHTLEQNHLYDQLYKYYL
ncbi:hypothetical protein D3C81_703100 [compost metagenome]